MTREEHDPAPAFLDGPLILPSLPRLTYWSNRIGNSDGHLVGRHTMPYASHMQGHYYDNIDKLLYFKYKAKRL